MFFILKSSHSNGLKYNVEMKNLAVARKLNSEPYLTPILATLSSKFDKSTHFPFYAISCTVLAILHWLYFHTGHTSNYAVLEHFCC